MELLLTNGQKIVVNVAWVKPYFSSKTVSPVNNLQFDAPSVPPTGMPMFDPNPLTLAHSRRPGRPRKLIAEEKVLSPTPTVSFSNLGVDDSLPVGVPPANEMVLSSARTHHMCNCSHSSPATAVAVTQNALTARLNNILSWTFRCVLTDPECILLQNVSPRKIRLRVPTLTRKAPPFGDPYKYSDDPTVDHYEAQPQPSPFNDVIRDGFFEDDDHGFQLEDLIPILEDDEDEYDFHAAFHHYEADADYCDKGEDDPQVPLQPQQGDREEEAEPPILRPMSPFDQRRWITTPRCLLPDEGGEDEGAISGEVWETPAMLDVQRVFYTALLDEVDNYTRASEVTQRTLRSLASTQQQRVQAEIRKRTQELQEQLEWAEKALDSQAISDAKLEHAFQPLP